MGSNNLTESKLVWKNSYVTMSKNLPRTKPRFSGHFVGVIQFKPVIPQIIHCFAPRINFVVSVYKSRIKQTKPKRFPSFLLFLALNRSDIVMNFIVFCIVRTALHSKRYQVVLWLHVCYQNFSTTLVLFSSLRFF